MRKYTPQQLKDAYGKLPPDLDKAISSVEVSEKIQEIGKKQNLMIDQMGELSSEVGLVMVGLTAPREFVLNLMERLKIDKVLAIEIAKEVNDQIFMKVRESLRKIHNLEEDAREIALKKKETSFVPENMKSTPVSSSIQKKFTESVVLGQEENVKKNIEEKPSNISPDNFPVEPSDTVDLTEPISSQPNQYLGESGEKADMIREKSLEEEVEEFYKKEKSVKEVSMLEDQTFPIKKELSEEKIGGMDTVAHGKIKAEEDRAIADLEKEIAKAKIEKREEDKNVFDEKIRGRPFRMMPEKTKYVEAGGDSKILVEEKVKTAYSHVDPYREPTE